MGRKFPAAVVLVLGLAALGGAYLLVSKRLSPLPAGTPLAEKDFAFVSDANVRKNLAAMAAKTTYRMTSVSSGKGTKVIVELQTAGSEIRSRTTEYDGEKVLSDYISIGAVTYVKDLTDGKWWQQATNPMVKREGSAFKSFAPEDVLRAASESAANTQYRFLGNEPCGNLKCYRYEQIIAGMPTGAQNILLFDDKEFLTRRVTAGYGEFLSTQDYSYDNISVTAPTPTKDVPAGKSIYEYF